MEQVGIILLISGVFAAIAVLHFTGLADPIGKRLGQRVANRIACGPRAPGVCRQHPTVSAYGWDVARAVRLLAPGPVSRIGPDGTGLAPVDFRYCQRPSCAKPAGDGRLTTANRRLTLFTVVSPLPSEGWRFTYWFYRPSLGWESVIRFAAPAEIEAASDTRVLLKDSPALVPLEILPGRNHYELPSGDEAPWRWRVVSRHPGWSV